MAKCREREAEAAGRRRAQAAAVSEPMTEALARRPELSRMGETALSYAEVGFAVFPLHGIAAGGGCTCGDPKCPPKRVGKHPRTKHGLKEATKDPETIKKWWHRWPDANIGLATGAISGVFVLDVDGVAGAASLIALAQAHGPLPRPPVVRTGRGRHAYFALPANGAPVLSRTGIAPGLDVRGEGGYAVAPPSLHASGVRYAWHGGEAGRLLEPPAWLLTLINGPKSQRPGNGADGAPTAASPPGDALTARALATAPRPPYSEAEAGRARDALRHIPAADRGDWLNVGMALHWTRWGETAYELWTKWSQSAPDKYDEQDQRATWESFDRGYAGPPITLGTLFHMARQGGWVPRPAHAPQIAAPERRVVEEHAHAPDDAEIAPSADAVESPSSAPTPGADDAELARLATLPPLGYDRERKGAAKRLGCRESILDRLVAALRGGADDGKQGRPLVLPPTEPWPEPVDGDAVLNELTLLITRYVIMSRTAADAIALWVLHTYLLDAAQATPRLAIKSPEKRCGKTTLLSLISKLVQRPLPASNVTPAALFRAVEAAHPTLLIDEADTFIAPGGGQHTPVSDELRGIINSGHTRDMAYVVRVVGEAMEPRKFSTWAPMALAAIGRLPGTIEDRSIVASLRRRRRDEPVARLRHDRDGHIRDAARRAARWAADHAAEIGRLDPAVPLQLNDRAADNWRPLLAIADAAGGDWPERARAAAIELSAEAEAGEDGESRRTQLLADIRAAFEAKGTDQVASADLVSHLVELADRPWAECRRGKSMTQNWLANQLQPFGIKSGGVWIAGRTLRGYARVAFEDAFARYLGNTGGPAR
jgi:Protein of unknown function (DUF3631)/Bifunctional DNA primase/polymerase, N-terminal/Primase C terminal 2 (PriCT-2)